VLLVKVLMGKILLKVFEGKNTGNHFSAVNHFNQILPLVYQSAQQFFLYLYL